MGLTEQKFTAEVPKEAIVTTKKDRRRICPNVPYGLSRNQMTDNVVNN